MSTSTEFASASLTAGQFNAIVKKLGGHNMALSFLRGELLVSEPTPLWREENGIIYFSVTSDGTTGKDWIMRLEDNGFRVGNYAKQVLRSPNFKPTNGVTTEVAVLKGVFFKDGDQVSKSICVEANKRNLSRPNAEVACLIRKKFTDKDIERMGLWYIVAMHEPIKDSDDNLCLLRAHRAGSGRLLDVCSVMFGHRWWSEDGFAFVVSH